MNRLIKSLFLILIIFSGLCSCNKKKIDEIHAEFEHHIEITEFKESLNFSEIIEDYKIIPLETNSNCLLSKIIKSIVYKDSIYIQTKSGVFCFTMNGKFVFAINNKGKGPSEFLSIFDFNIDNGKIYLYDQFLHRINVYGAKDGTFIKNVKIKYIAKQAEVLNDMLFVNRPLLPMPNIDKRDSSRVIISNINEQDNIIFKSFPYINKVYHLQGEYDQLNIYNQNAYWTDGLFSRVYKWNGQDYDNYIHVDCGSQSISLSDYSIFPSPTQLLKDGKSLQLSDVFENSGFIVANLYIGTGFEKLLCFDKDSKKNIVFVHTIGEPWEISPSKFDGTYNDYFYSFIYSMSYSKTKLNMKTDNANTMRDKEAIKCIINSTINDNPQIALYKFQKIKE